MAKKVRRVPFLLNPLEERLTKTELKAILRGAGSLIMEGGHNLLAKTLKESQDKRHLPYRIYRRITKKIIHHSKVEGNRLTTPPVAAEIKGDVRSFYIER